MERAHDYPMNPTATEQSDVAAGYRARSAA